MLKINGLLKFKKKKRCAQIIFALMLSIYFDYSYILLSEYKKCHIRFAK